MKLATLILCMLAIATVAVAEKAPAVYPDNAPLISERQGGDTVADAVPILTMPFTGSGTTVGYVNDYDAVCNYTGSTAPEVVYSLVACDTGFLEITLCIDPTDYDTKLYVTDADLNLIRCNDDWCSVPVSYVSELTYDNEGADPLFGVVPVTVDEMYYIFVDGYSSASGNYGISITGLDCVTPTEETNFGVIKAMYR
ncbi:hypothetical protein H8E52_03300 [bacterium]|nr:hypothetical protein [bacterium]